MSDAAAPPGLDLPQVEAWCATHLGAAPPLDVTSVGVGQSNLTYRVVDRTGRAWALRRPPTGPLRPTAHDVVREARILRCVAGGPPVPVVAGVCEDVAVTGAPFYVMDYLEGRIVSHSALRALDRQERGKGELSAIQEVERDFGTQVVSIVSLNDVIAYLEETGAHAEHMASIRQYRESYGIG